MDLEAGRPSTPNTVMYDDDLYPTNRQKMSNSARPISSNSLKAPHGFQAPPPALYSSPDKAEDVHSVGGKIWTIEGTEDPEKQDILSLDEEDETRILLEKEFDDYYEEHVHKSAGPVVFVSKVLGMIPVIWTEDESESECKSYFNLYTFVIFVGWVGLATISGLRVNKDDVVWPDTATNLNGTDPIRFITKSSADTYMACTWLASLVTLLFGVFKCRSFAEVLFGLSETDAQLELQEKHYEKIKRKSLYWIVFLLMLLVGHAVAFTQTMVDSVGFDILILLSDTMAHATVFVLDLQYLYMIMILCKRYRLCNKILVHITKPWKTFRDEQPSNFVVQNILQYRFDQIFEPGGDDPDGLDLLKKKSSVPIEKLIKNCEEPKISREEENTFIVQLDILRGIHADLSSLSQEVSQLFGIQMLFHVISLVIFCVMFGYFFAASMLNDEFYWPYLVLFILPAIRIFLIGHWGQCLEQTARQPFMTICQMSTIDGSPKLERQVQKLTMQMKHQCPTLKAAGYFSLGRNMILKTFAAAVVFTFFMVQFEKVEMMQNPLTTITK